MTTLPADTAPSPWWPRTVPAPHLPVHRILHLLPDLRIGGGQTVVLNHLRHADTDRFPVLLATLAGDATAAHGIGPEVEVLLGRPAIEVGRGGGTARRIAALVRLLHREHIDVLHVHSDVDRRVGQVAALLTRTPVVSHLHAEWVHLGPKRPATPSPWRFLRARLVAGVTDRVERRTVRRYVATSARVRALVAPAVHQPIDVVDHGITQERFGPTATSRQTTRSELDIAPDDPVLVCVARLVPGKGHDVLLDAFAILRATWPDVHLLLVGDGPRRPELEARAERLGVARAVRFLGDRHDVPDLLGGADVFVLASETEGFGLCALEAMAAGLPVVATRCPAFEEFVVDGTTGDLVAPGDARALARTLHDLLLDPQRGDRYGAAGHAVVADRYRPAAVARSLEAAYAQVVAHHPRRVAPIAEVAR